MITALDTACIDHSVWICLGFYDRYLIVPYKLNIQFIFNNKDPLLSIYYFAFDKMFCDSLCKPTTVDDG